MIPTPSSDRGKEFDPRVSHIHVPTPGDHYSPATGSAVMTVISQIAKQHAMAQGRTGIVVSQGTRHDYPVGECLEVRATTPPSKWQRGLDVILSRCRGPRLFGTRSYLPASRAIPRHYQGVVFVHNDPSAIGMLRRHHPRASLCLWLHNDVFRSYTTREIKRIEGRLDRVIACSHYIGRTFEARLRRDCPKLCTIHNGVDTSTFRPAPRSDDHDVVLFLGRVQPVKGADLLLRACETLWESGLKFKLRIVGSSNFNSKDPLTPYERQLRKMADPLSDRVEFRPFLDRNSIAAEYRQASIFCAPSNWDEPFGLTVLEAMSCGLPVVTSYKGGIPEFAGKHVLYFDPPNVEALAAKLSMMLRDKDLRTQLGAAARQAALERDWAAVYQRLIGCLAER